MVQPKLDLICHENLITW